MRLLFRARKTALVLGASALLLATGTTAAQAVTTHGTSTTDSGTMSVAICRLNCI
ncbi:hypothetical protein [Streptomyces dioscori]|uniref:hypothetical protein n=1 Tax=Streptomyces dioscori TaxID=2109333 RepID=UPI00131A96D7|nr:hypothetical protein [Streptomyces dioscori]